MNGSPIFEHGNRLLALRVRLLLFLTVALAISHTCVSFCPLRPLLRLKPTSRLYKETVLALSLKPAASPLMDSGKALARSGELLIDLTSSLDLYGGGLSAAGALIRNSGDRVAQAAASCRFKTGYEFVCDELREAATCLTEATQKLKLAIVEAEADKDDGLARRIGKELKGVGCHHFLVDRRQNDWPYLLTSLTFMLLTFPIACTADTLNSITFCASHLEAAGAGIMQKLPKEDIGSQFVSCGENLDTLAVQIRALAPEKRESVNSASQLNLAANGMMEAGRQLQGIPNPNLNGKSWLKG